MYYYIMYYLSAVHNIYLYNIYIHMYVVKAAGPQRDNPVYI